jgi:hypothetical protein
VHGGDVNTIGALILTGIMIYALLFLILHAFYKSEYDNTKELCKEQWEWLLIFLIVVAFLLIGRAGDWGLL